MRFRYSTVDPSHNELDSMPWLSLVLRHQQRVITGTALVDSGATVNVMPYTIGLQLGAIWNDSKAVIRLAGALGNQPAIPFFVRGELGEYTPVRLAFAWIKSDHAPIVLGQMNFFMEFDICFYRSISEFEVKLKSN